MRAILVDIETTGINPNIHVPLEICVAVVKLYENNISNDISMYHSRIACSAENWGNANHHALLVNGCDEACISCGDSKEKVSNDLAQFLISEKLYAGSAFFFCQNPTFDKPFFDKLISPDFIDSYGMPYHWLDLASMYWMKFFAESGFMLPEAMSLSKDAIAQTLGIPIEFKPHNAINGVKHLLECYKALIAYDKIE